MLLHSLQPIVDTNSRVLILGSMPGRVSLAAAQYYAHPRNRFWHILFDFFSQAYSTDYADRIALCRVNGIALWDAAAVCRRTGSLDATMTDVVGNDIDGLLKTYPHIRAVVCNGRASEKYCRKFNAVRPLYLPSTSPLNVSVKDVDAQWKAALHDILSR